MASVRPSSGGVSLAAAVLCGGQSRRMGRDKAMLPLVDGRLPEPIAEAAARFRSGADSGGLQFTLLDWALVRLLSVTPVVAVAGSRPEHAAIAALFSSATDHEPVAVLADPVEGMGPLAGLVAALDWAEGRGSEWLLTMPVDAAMIPCGCLIGLANMARKGSAGGRPSYLVSGTDRQFLCSVWPVIETRVAAVSALSRGELAIHRLHRDLGSEGVETGQLGVSGPLAGVALMNANTPEEHRMVQAEVAQRAEELVRI